MIKIIQNAFDSAKASNAAGVTKQVRHRNRSKNFVEALADGFRKQHPQKDIRVFSKHCSENRKEFKLNELLFDVCVCEVGHVRSAQKGIMLPYVKKGIWAVESEFARDSSQAVVDFNKLVLASADDKLFICSQVNDQRAFLDTLGPVADACSGKVYLACVPHPRDWREGEMQEVELYLRGAGEWENSTF